MKELRELLAKSTPGEWSVIGHSRINGVTENGIGSPHDAALICAMKNALPSLLDKVERYEKALRKTQEFLSDPQHGQWKYVENGYQADDMNELSTHIKEALEGAGHADG